MFFPRKEKAGEHLASFPPLSPSTAPPWPLRAPSSDSPPSALSSPQVPPPLRPRRSSPTTSYSGRPRFAGTASSSKPWGLKPLPLLHQNPIQSPNRSPSNHALNPLFLLAAAPESGLRSPPAWNKVLRWRNSKCRSRT